MQSTLKDNLGSGDDRNNSVIDKTFQENNAGAVDNGAKQNGINKDNSEYHSTPAAAYSDCDTEANTKDSTDSTYNHEKTPQSEISSSTDIHKTNTDTESSVLAENSINRTKKNGKKQHIQDGEPVEGNDYADLINGDSATGRSKKTPRHDVEENTNSETNMKDDRQSSVVEENSISHIEKTNTTQDVQEAGEAVDESIDSAKDLTTDNKGDGAISRSKKRPRRCEADNNDNNETNMKDNTQSSVVGDNSIHHTEKERNTQTMQDCEPVDEDNDSEKELITDNSDDGAIKRSKKQSRPGDEADKSDDNENNMNDDRESSSVAVKSINRAKKKRTTQAIQDGGPVDEGNDSAEDVTTDGDDTISRIKKRPRRSDEADNTDNIKNIQGDRRSNFVAVNGNFHREKKGNKKDIQDGEPVDKSNDNADDITNKSCCDSNNDSGSNDADSSIDESGHSNYSDDSEHNDSFYATSDKSSDTPDSTQVS